MDPGESLFCGGGLNLEVDLNAQDQEEEEQLEEQRRRNEELGNLIANQFDDLTDGEEEDDEDGDENVSGSSIGSSDAGSPPQPGYFPYDGTPRKRAHQDESSFADGSEEIIRARHLAFRGNRIETARKISGDHLPHEALYNGFNTSADNEENSMYHGSPYHPESPDCENENDFISSDNRFYRQADLGSQEELMVMYGAKVREINRLTKTLETLRHEKTSEVELLKRALLLMEAEKEGAIISQKEAHNVLAASKTQINSLQEELDRLQNSNIGLESDNAELSKQVNILKSTAADLQQKVLILERNGNTTGPTEKQTEAFYKNLQQKHQEQLTDLQSQLENYADKFRKKDADCAALEEKLRNCEKAYESLQVAKSETVRNLATQLEEYQRQLQALASNSAVQETTKLKILLEQTQSDKKAVEEKLARTSKKLDSAEKDLQQYESAAKLGLFNNGDSSFETDSITHMGMTRRHSSGGRSDKHPDNSRDSNRSKRYSSDKDDLYTTLKTELYRALQGQRSKREEIRRLQEQIAAKDNKIKSMLEQEQVYVKESKLYEANLGGVLERLKRQQEDLKTARGSESRLRKKCEELEAALKETAEMADHVKALEKETADLREQLTIAQEKEMEEKVAQEFYDESLNRAKEEVPPGVEKELIDLRVRLDQSQKDCSEIKKLYIEASADKRELKTRLEEKEASLSEEIRGLKDEGEKLECLYKEALHTIQDLEAERNQLQSSLDKAVLSANSVNNNELERAKEKVLIKCKELQERIVALECENKRVHDLEQECSRLRDDLTSASLRHQEELSRISKELSYSRERLLKLRDESQIQIDTLTTEREVLQKQLEKKDQLVEELLSRMNRTSRDAETTTDEGLWDRASATHFQKAEENLRQKFDRTLATKEMEIKAAFEKHLIALSAQHKAEIAAVRDEVRQEVVRYYAEELANSQEKHVQEIDILKLNATKHFESMKKALQDRMLEIEELRKNNASKNSSESDALVEELQHRIESDRNKIAELLTCWTKEVQEVREQEVALEKELSDITEKLKHARKAALYYRKISLELAGAREREASMEEELSDIREKFRKAKKAAIHYKKMSEAGGDYLRHVQDRVQEAVGSH